MPKNTLLPWRTPPPFNWARFPLLLPAIVLGIGVLLAHWNNYVGATLTLGILVGLLLISGPLIFQKSIGRSRRKRTAYLLLGAVLLLGYWRAASTHPLHWADHFQTTITETARFQVRILETKPSETRLRTKVSVEAVYDNEQLQTVRGLALVYLMPSAAANRLKAGDRYLFSGQLQAMKPPLNPAAFDFQAYWSGQYIHHQAFLRADEDWQLLSRGKASWTDRAEHLRDGWIAKFRPYLADDELAVASALVLGKRDLISEDLRSAYADTGAVHVLAVSGLHVGILAFLLAWLLNVILPGKGLMRWLRLLLNLTGIWGFALLTGFSPSVQRAALMFSVIIIGQQRKQQPNLFNSLSAAAIFILLIDPQQIFGVGFQLSFSAVAGIGLFHRRINRSLYFPYAWLRSIWSVLSVSLAAQIGTLPLVIYYFQQFPLYFLLSGSIVILTAYGGLVLGLLHGLVAWLIPAAAPITGWALSLVIGLQNSVVYFCRQLPGAAQQLFPINWWQLLLLFTLIGGLVIWLQWRRFRVAVALLSGLVLLGGFRLSQVYHFSQREGVVVYHQYRHSLLEVNSGYQGAALQSDLSPLQLERLSEGHHKLARYTVSEKFSLPLATEGAALLQDNHLQINGSLLQIHDRNWLILEKDIDLREFKFPEINRVLIRSGARPRQLPDSWAQPAAIFIFDGSNPAYRRQEWEDWADTHFVSLHVTSRDGAWVE